MVIFRNTLSGLLFADDFVGVAKTRSALQKLIDIVHNYSVVLIYKVLLTLTRRIQDKYSDVRLMIRLDCLVAEQVGFAC